MVKIALSGTPGSGKSTAARLLAKKLNLRHYSTGEFMRKIARDRNVSIVELNELAESDLSIDQEIENYSKKIGQTEDDFVIDSRLAYHFIPDSIKIFFDADLDERARRIAQDNRQDEPHEIKAVKKEIQKRRELEKERYRELYNLDPYDKSNYDLVIDTTDSTPEKNVQKIIKFLKKQQIL